MKEPNLMYRLIHEIIANQSSNGIHLMNLLTFERTHKINKQYQFSINNLLEAVKN